MHSFHTDQVLRLLLIFTSITVDSVGACSSCEGSGPPYDANGTSADDRVNVVLLQSSSRLTPHAAERASFALNQSALQLLDSIENVAVQQVRVSNASVNTTVIFDKPNVALYPTLQLREVRNWHGFGMWHDPTDFDDVSEKYRQAVMRTLNEEGITPVMPIGKCDTSHCKPTIWLHVHHAAGTSVCLVAIANGERAVVPNENCNWITYDNLRPVPRFGNLGIGAKDFEPPSCDQRTAYFKTWNFTFGMIEREFHQADLCPGFRYATLLRQPLEFLESLVLFRIDLMRDAAVKFGVANQAQTAKYDQWWFKELLSKVFFHPTSQLVAASGGLEGWQLLDNYHIRSILGDDAFGAGPGMIRASHLEKATQRLLKFDFVKTIDHDSFWDGASDVLGWKGVLNAPANKNSRTTEGASRKVFDDSLRDSLAQINKYDLALFHRFA